MARHGLILGEHEATACTDLLEALLAQYRPIWGRFWVDLPGTGVWGSKILLRKREAATQCVHINITGVSVQLPSCPVNAARGIQSGG